MKESLGKSSCIKTTAKALFSLRRRRQMNSLITNVICSFIHYTLYLQICNVNPRQNSFYINIRSLNVMCNIQENLLKLGNWSVGARDCVKNSSIQTEIKVIKHQPFDKTNVYHTGSIHYTYEIYVYILRFSSIYGKYHLCSNFFYITQCIRTPCDVII